MSRKLVLASQSPRRREILQQAGFHFTVRASNIPERMSVGESVTHYVRRLARSKAESALPAKDEIVLGADTVVVLDEHILEKPHDAADAARMIRMLSGRSHRVLTGICLIAGNSVIVDYAETEVHFFQLSDEEILGYAESGEPLDKAGGYAIQGLASKFIHRIQGCYFNVVGLPISLVYRYLKSLRYDAV